MKCFKRSVKVVSVCIFSIVILACLVVLFITEFPEQANKMIEIFKPNSSEKNEIVQAMNSTGWVTENNERCYYQNNQKATGWVTIGKHRYFFNEAGILQKNKMISQNQYVNGKGRLVSKAHIYDYQKQGMEDLETKLSDMKNSYSGTWSIYVKNLDTNEYLSINNQPMHPASLMKLFNLGYTYECIHKGTIEKTQEVESWLWNMITVSSNDAYNELLQMNGDGNVLEGARRVTDFCERREYKDTLCGGTLHPSYFSPAFISNFRTSVENCGHILEDIYRGILVSEEDSDAMLTLLKNQTKRYKIPSGIPEDVVIANKTGEADNSEHDAAIVFSPKADYIIVIMTESDGAAIEHIGAVSKTVYDYFNDTISKSS